MSAAPATHRRRRWPWLAGAAALLLVVGLTGLTFLGGGGGEGAVQAAAMPLTVGTGSGASLEFEPTTVQAPANTPVNLTFSNQSTLPHNLTFQDAIQAQTSDLPGGANETISFTTPGPGAYTFVCTLHPGMEGTLTVQ